MPALPIPTLEDGTVDRLAWLAMRLPFFNASSAALLYQLDHDIHYYGRTLADEAVRKITRDVTEEKAPELARGHYLERGLLDFVEDEVGVAILPPTVMYADGCVSQTPDGEFVGSDTDQPEVKTTTEWDPGEPFPLPWHLQAVAQCVARPTLERVHFGVLDRWLRLSHHVIEPEQWEKDDLAERAAAFMASVQLGMVPEGLPLSYRNVVDLYPPAVPPVTVEVDGDGLDLLRSWDEARQARLVASKYEDDVRDAVANLLRAAEGAAFEGVPVVSWKVDARGARVLRPLKGLWAASAVPVLEGVA